MDRLDDAGRYLFLKTLDKSEWYSIEHEFLNNGKKETFIQGLSTQFQFDFIHTTSSNQSISQLYMSYLRISPEST
jgi:hypothetical protein